MTANVQDLTVPELYSLAWEVAERLVELEVERLTAATEPDRGSEALVLADFDNATTNYGAW